MTDTNFQTAAMKALRKELEGQNWIHHQTPERAFIHWYAVARYGKGAPVQITDGTGDGGIDAIVEENGTRVVVQAKYEKVVRLSNVSPADLADFQLKARLIREREAEEEFALWLKNVRSELHQKYRQLRRLALEDPSRVRFDFVTTKRIASHQPAWVDPVDVDRLAPLWSLYEEGFTPPTEAIELEFEDLWSKGGARDSIRNYVGLADVQAFLRLMAKDEHERLFAQNVRTDLRTRLNDHIRETYEKHPDEFWMGNNGIYVVCSKAMRTGDSLRLIYPSIINGSQTLHSIARSAKRHECRVLVRVLELDTVSNRSLLASIIKRTNSQNAMKPMNLAAHDREQFNVARHLDRLSHFYERRENEWKNEKKSVLLGYSPVKMKDVAQWLAVSVAGIGMGTARAKVKDLFSEDKYVSIFGRFTDDLRASSYTHLSAAVASGLLVQDWLKTLKPASRGEARITQLMYVRAVYEAIRSSDSLLAKGDDVLRRRLYQCGRDTAISGVLRGIQAVAVETQKRYSREKEEVDLSNFFKRDRLTDMAWDRAATSATIRALSAALRDAFAE